MSSLLRHNAVDEGIEITSAGWVALDDLIKWLNKKGHNKIDLETIQEIVDSNNKKRFELEKHGHHYVVRATQGHTMKEVKTEDLLTKIEDPEAYPVVIHGTFGKFWPLIKKEGLKRMARNHIHFAPGLPKEEGVISGMRSSCEIIIEIDLLMAIKDGIEFYISSNNVILTEGDKGVLSPKYFKKIMRKNGDELQE